MAYSPKPASPKPQAPLPTAAVRSTVEGIIKVAVDDQFQPRIFPKAGFLDGCGPRPCTTELIRANTPARYSHRGPSDRAEGRRTAASNPDAR